jgi:hypothetical protein
MTGPTGLIVAVPEAQKRIPRRAQRPSAHLAPEHRAVARHRVAYEVSAHISQTAGAIQQPATLLSQRIEVAARDAKQARSVPQVVVTGELLTDDLSHQRASCQRAH